MKLKLEDNLYPVLSIYNSLPLFIRNIFGKLYGFLPKFIRHGGFYKHYTHRINSFKSYSDIETQIEIEKLLFEQVNDAITNVHFYKNFNKISTINEFEKLPVIEKSTINAKKDHFINSKLKNESLEINTGGSNGSPFAFFIQKGITRAKEAAHFDWYWSQYGYKYSDKVLMIRGKSLRKNANYEYQAIGNKLVISCYNLNKSSIEDIYNQILKFNPKYIHAYPSSLLIFTKVLSLFLKDKKPVFSVKAIFLGSEFLYEHDKVLFMNFYNTKIVNWYGHSECLIHGYKCELSGDYHFYPFYGYLELVDENDNLITEPNIAGRIVATGFDNKVMPLIRYDTGDIGVYSEKKQCECGFKGKSLSQIVGRGKDFIVLKDGTQVTLTAFIFGQHHKEFSKIKEMQIIQDIPGEITLKLVALDELSIEEQIRLVNRLTHSVKKDSLVIHVVLVDNIKKTHRGKHRILIQNIT